MINALLIYSTVDGQSKKIMQAIAQQLMPLMQVDIIKYEPQTKIDLTPYGAICIGASIRYGRFNHSLKRFIDQNAEQLNQKTTAFFSVTLIARKNEKRTPETNVYTRKFLEASRWHPLISETFAGALRYPHYSWFDRFIIQQIMRMTGGETDTNKEIEYTDWQQVNNFTNNFKQAIVNQAN